MYIPIVFRIHLVTVHLFEIPVKDEQAPCEAEHLTQLQGRQMRYLKLFTPHDLTRCPNSFICES